MAKLKSGTTIAGSTAWHAGNDGASSGLDADLLDGNHASAFATSGHNHDASYLKLTGGTLTGELTVPTQLTISEDSPQIKFNDTNSNYDFWIHVNSNNFYVLNDHDGNGSWDGNYPLQLEGDTDIGYMFGQRVFTDSYHPNADKWTTSRTLSLSGDASGSVSIDGSANVTLSVAVANDSHTHAFNNLSGKGAGTGEYSTSGALTSGRGSGGVSLTINDGYGNANVTFNHKNGVPEQNGAALRIETNTDTSGEGRFDFEASSGAVTANTAVSLPVAMSLGHDYMEIPNVIRHTGDTDTYMQFNAANSWRVVTGNTEGLKVSGNNVDIPDAIRHTGNTATYMQFHATDQWRVVTNNTERLEIDNSYIHAHQNFRALAKVELDTNASLFYQSSGGGGFIPYPRGGHYYTTTGTHTGAIKIDLPVHGAADMISFWVDIFDYATSESISYFIAGYLYQTTGNNEWVNVSARAFITSASQHYAIRYGADGNTNCVWIGETNTTWSHPQVTVRDVQVGYSADPDSYDTGWSVSFVTAFDTVDETLAAGSVATLPRASHALNADTVGNLSSGSFIRSNANDDVTGHTEWQDNYEVRLGTGADFRMWHDGTNTYFRNYNHGAGSIYFEGEDAEGTNHALLYMRNNVSQPYLQLFQNGGERLRTLSGGVGVTGLTVGDVDANPHNSGGLQVSNTNNEKIVLSGSNDPYIRWQEGTTDKAYIQWRSSYGELYFRNQEAGTFAFSSNSATTATRLNLLGSDNDFWGALYAADGEFVGILDGDSNWAVEIRKDYHIALRVNNAYRFYADNSNTWNYRPLHINSSNGYIANPPTWTTSRTIEDGYNAMSAGPITVNNGVTVTIGDGETWTIV